VFTLSTRRFAAKLVPFAAAAAFAGALPATASADGPNCAGADLQPDASNIVQVQQATLCLVNYQRTSHGLRALSENALLDKASLEHSQDMVARKYFEHDTPNGVTVVDRLQSVGYITGSVDWVAGENIAWGQSYLGSPAKTVDAWMNSAGHRANILAPDYKEMGMGIVPAAPVADSGGFSGATYTNDFGGLGGGQSAGTTTVRSTPKAAPKRRAHKAPTCASRARAAAAHVKGRRAKARAARRARTRCVTAARRASAARRAKH
jgi:uncharacterized protein YkwD